jgi:hypothetical protein
MTKVKTIVKSVSSMSEGPEFLGRERQGEGK